MEGASGGIAVGFHGDCLVFPHGFGNTVESGFDGSVVHYDDVAVAPHDGRFTIAIAGA